MLLILDLGRPERFVNMLRIFKPRSPMSMGAWALTLFGNLAAGAVGADLLGGAGSRSGSARANAIVGGYLGSYTGVLLASTAVPVWARSRLFLGPIFVCTAAATGAAACRLALVADGLPVGHPTRRALGHGRDGRDGGRARALDRSTSAASASSPRGLEQGRPGTLFKAAKWSVRVGLALRFARRRWRPVGAPRRERALPRRRADVPLRVGRRRAPLGTA